MRHKERSLAALPLPLPGAAAKNPTLLRFTTTAKEQKQLSYLAIKMDYGVQITEEPDLFLTRMNVRA